MGFRRGAAPGAGMALVRGLPDTTDGICGLCGGDLGRPGEPGVGNYFWGTDTRRFRAR